ncbi:MAG: hypothetical protein GEU96_17740 [Propionibacteriales bacterium]|nr:hypothetical protein [Propionibacteriales bacterium]
MHSNNPVFARSEGFSGRQTTPTYPGGGAYSDPSTWQTGGPGDGGVGTGVQERMTIDSVVLRTATTLFLLVAVAAATWVVLPDLSEPGVSTGSTMMAWMVGAFGGLGVALVISFKKVINPALVLVYAALEGLFIGAMSKYFEAMWPGIVMSAVFGTFIAFAATLAAYKFFNIRVTPRFRKVVTIAAFGFVGMVMLDFVLGFFGASFGWNELNGLGMVATVIGLVLGVLMLVLDFDFVERGVEAGLPERESWRAAFGLTVTLVWLYIEMLRLIAALRGE